MSFKVICKRQIQRCDIRLFLSDDDPLAPAASFTEVEGRAAEGEGRTLRALGEGGGAVQRHREEGDSESQCMEGAAVRGTVRRQRIVRGCARKEGTGRNIVKKIQHRDTV